MKQFCDTCANFLSCASENDVRGYCSSDPNVVGYCSLWDGAIYKTKSCEGWATNSQ